MSPSQTKASNSRADLSCPCGSGNRYAQCCLPYLSGNQPPPTAEALMRSRYSAYVQNMASFLLQTWHLSTRPVQLDLAPQASLKWLGLKIIHCTAGTSHDDIGMVEFIARCKQHGKAVRLHESSQFIKENGRWFYLRAN